MKPFLLRLAACLFVVVSSSSHAAIAASDQDVFFSGSVDYLDDPNELFSGHNLSLGDSFTAGYSIDPSVQVGAPFASAIDPQLMVYPIASGSVIVDFVGSSQSNAASLSTYVVIGNDVTLQSEVGVLTGDWWSIESYFFTPTYGAIDFQISFLDTSGTMINNNDFFINTSINGWGQAGVFFGSLSVPYDLHMRGISEVPIPATAWLFGSALAGLLVARKKNDE